MEIDRDLPLLVALAVAFLAAVVLAASETALLRITKVRATTLVEEGRSGARVLERLVNDLPKVLSAILLTALLSQITAATIMGILADRWFGSLGVTLASIGLTVLLFIYGEAIPKTFAVRHPDTVALTVAPAVAGLSRVLRPIIAVLVWIADLQIPGRSADTSPTVTESELRSLASLAVGEGQITEWDRMLIERAFRLGDQRADDIMVPRLDVVAVAGDTPVDEALQTALQAGHRRLPVYAGSLDDTTGLVQMRDMVLVPLDIRSSLTVSKLAEPALLVPESKRVFDLLADMQDADTHLAIVIDEHGGTAGIVTLEDIVEELLGSLSEEHPGAGAITEVSPGVWHVEASATVEDVAAVTGFALPEGEWNTVAGVVMGVTGRLPELGEEVAVDDVVLRVAGLRSRRITRVELRRTRPDSGAS